MTFTDIMDDAIASKHVRQVINPMTGCLCTFVQHMLGDGCWMCNPEQAKWYEEMSDD